MTRKELEYLKEIAKKYGIYDRIAKSKRADQNPLENSMWENMINGALKALEAVALMSLDWKLTAIVKLLQSWLKDRREEKVRMQQQTEYGVGGYSYDDPSPYDDSYGGGGSYY